MRVLLDTHVLLWALAEPRRLDDPLVQTAIRTQQGEAIAGWARFLAAEIDPSDRGTVVVLRDVPRPVDDPITCLARKVTSAPPPVL